MVALPIVLIILNIIVAIYAPDWRTEVKEQSQSVKEAATDE
jgi:hypothetical protein